MWLQHNCVHCARVYLTLSFLLCHEMWLTLGPCTCDSVVVLPAAGLLLHKWRRYLIVVGGKDAGHSCMLSYRLGCSKSTSKCGGVEPTQWAPVTTSFCLSRTVKITPVILLLHWKELFDLNCTAAVGDMPSRLKQPLITQKHKDFRLSLSFIAQFIKTMIH